MPFHGNAKLGLAGRHALVCAVESATTLKRAPRLKRGTSHGSAHQAVGASWLQTFW